MAKIVSIHSFRGGTGKSNLMANIAATLARQGQRIGIVDTDIQSPGIHVIFGLDQEKMDSALNDYLWGRCHIKDAAYDVSHILEATHRETLVGAGAFVGDRQSCTYPPSIKANGCLYVIPSSTKASEISRVLREGYDVVRLNDGFQEIIHYLNLDYLLIDTHPGLNEETLISIGISNVLVVLLRPDSQDFLGTAVTVDVARKLKVSKMLLVVNKVLPVLDFHALRQQVETTYNVEVAGIVPASDEMMLLGSKGLFCMLYPDHLISQIVEEIAFQIAKEG